MIGGGEGRTSRLILSSQPITPYNRGQQGSDHNITRPTMVGSMYSNLLASFLMWSKVCHALLMLSPSSHLGVIYLKSFLGTPGRQDQPHRTPNEPSTAAEAAQLRTLLPTASQ